VTYCRDKLDELSVRSHATNRRASKYQTEWRGENHTERVKRASVLPRLFRFSVCWTTHNRFNVTRIHKRGDCTAGGRLLSYFFSIMTGCFGGILGLVSAAAVARIASFLLFTDGSRSGFGFKLLSAL
jgi:hypothetical protein